LLQVVTALRDPDEVAAAMVMLVLPADANVWEVVAR